MFDRDLLSFRTPKLPTFQLDHDAIQRGMEEKYGYANVLFNRLMDQIMRFQAQLNPDEEVGAYLASFGREVYLQARVSCPFEQVWSKNLADEIVRLMRNQG